MIFLESVRNGTRTETLGSERETSNFPGNHPANLPIRRTQESHDSVAFEQLFKQFYKPLCSFCVRLVLVSEVAEEIVSDLFFSIWKNRSRFAIKNPRAYLYSAVRNRCLDYLRTKKIVFCTLESAAHLPSENHTLHEALEHQELESRVHVGIRRLPRRCKMVYELSRDGMKYKDIAVALNISIKTVETQLSKALRELRKVREFGET